MNSSDKISRCLKCNEPPEQSITCTACGITLCADCYGRYHTREEAIASK